MPKRKKKAIKMGTEFPREDVKFHRQYTDTWTICTRCRVQNSAFSKQMHYVGIMLMGFLSAQIVIRM